jgi:hypothetical protein
LFMGSLGFGGCIPLFLLQHRSFLTEIMQPAWAQAPAISRRVPI